MTTNQIPDLSHRLVNVSDGQHNDVNLVDNLDTCLERVSRVALSLWIMAEHDNDGELPAEAARGMADVIRLEIEDARAILAHWADSKEKRPAFKIVKPIQKRSQNWNKHH